MGFCWARRLFPGPARSVTSAHRELAAVKRICPTSEKSEAEPRGMRLKGPQSQILLQWWHAGMGPHPNFLAGCTEGWKSLLNK